MNVNKEFNWEIFFTLLKRKLIIPIVGSDLILMKGENEKPVSLYEHIIGKLAKKLHIENKEANLWEFILKNKDTTLITSVLKPTFREISIDDLDLEPLNKLARITDFDFYMTTTFDGILGNIIKEIRNENSEEVEITNYSLTPNALPNKAKQTDVEVFNMLGNINERNGFARTTDEVLEYIFSLTNETPLVEKLKDQTEGKSLLLLGSNLPEWGLLFFIRTLSNEAYAKADQVKFIAEKKGNVASEYSLLNHFKTEIFVSKDEAPNNAIGFINELYKRWTEQTQTQIQIKYAGQVFLSCSKDDLSYVSNIYEVLQENGVDVILNLENGEVESNKKQVENNIKTCKLFIPFISENALLENTENQNLKKEWNLAEMRHIFMCDDDDETFVKPFLIDYTLPDNENIPDFFRNLNIQKIKDIDIIEEITNDLELI